MFKDSKYFFAGSAVLATVSSSLVMSSSVSAMEQSTEIEELQGGIISPAQEAYVPEEILTIKQEMDVLNNDLDNLNEKINDYKNDITKLVLCSVFFLSCQVIYALSATGYLNKPIKGIANLYNKATNIQ